METMETASKFSLKGYEVEAKIVKVYDGDSIHAVFPLPMTDDPTPYRWSCRIAGIDTPELRTKNDKERELAIEARDVVRSLILNEQVRIDLDDFDKYGRVLCKVFDTTGKPVSATLIEKGLAKEYHGGTKEKWII